MAGWLQWSSIRPVGLFSIAAQAASARCGQRRPACFPNLLQVFRGRWNGTEVAIKRVYDVVDESSLADFQKEVTLFAGLLVATHMADAARHSGMARCG